MPRDYNPGHDRETVDEVITQYEGIEADFVSKRTDVKVWGEVMSKFKGSVAAYCESLGISVDSLRSGVRYMPIGDFPDVTFGNRVNKGAM